MDDSTKETHLLLEEHNKICIADLKQRIWKESKLMWRVAFPAIIARVTSFGIIVITQSFLGHLGDLNLAAYGLVQTLLVRFVHGILLGMSSATETLCGQAFGAKQYHMMGIYLQRSWIVDGITATIFLPLFIFSTPILILLGQEEDIAMVASKISIWFIPFLGSLMFSLTIQMYLQAQMRNRIIGWLSTLSFVLHVVLSWILVRRFELGINGAMAALNISSWVVVVGEFVYIFGGWCPNTWQGFDPKSAIADMLPMLKLSLSSGVMLCLELWYNAILVLLAGYMKDAAIALAAFSICLNINAWEFMICLGFQSTASVRVSNELGNGDSKAVKFSIKMILAITSCIGVFFWMLWFVFHQKLSYLFTSNEEVVEAISDLSLLLSFSILLNSIQPVLTGVAIGAGMQGMVAVVNLGCYYIVGAPLGFLLGYMVELQIKGLWIGLLIGVGMQTVILSYIIWRTNWENEVKKASQRLDRWFLDPSKQSNDKSNGTKGSD